MHDTKTSIFEILPVEVFYEILNHLNILEIFHSFYNVCGRVDALLISYNRYKLDFSSILRFDFNIIYNIVQPKHIVSLVLSDDDRTPGQIGLFLSLFNIEDLHRLRSLSLIEVEERDLIIFLRHVSVHNLCSLTIHWRGGTRFHGHAVEIHKLLSSTISHSNLRYLDLNLWIYVIKTLPWPSYCFVHYLSLDDCSFFEYQLILDTSPHLRTFILTNCLMYDIDDIFSSFSFVRPSYFQLRSLSLKNMKKIRGKTLRSLVSVTPLLVYLKLTGSGRLDDHAFNGLKWENFIQNNLLSLDKFEFFFTTQKNGNQTVDNVSSLIIPFSTNFWKEKKRWFVACDFIKSLSQIRLYSIPICRSDFEYICKSDIISQSTLITKVDDNVERMTDVCVVSVNLSTAIIEQEDYTNLNSIFQQTTELELEINEQSSIIDSLHFFSIQLDLSHLTKISLNINFDNDFTSFTINAIGTLLKETPNIDTLHHYNRTANSDLICAIVPRHVKHLKVKVNRIKDMKIILEYLDNLSSVVFQFQYPLNSSNYPSNIIKWLKQRGTSFTFWCNSFCINLWLDHNFMKLKDVLQQTID